MREIVKKILGYAYLNETSESTEKELNDYSTLIKELNESKNKEPLTKKEAKTILVALKDPLFGINEYLRDIVEDSKFYPFGLDILFEPLAEFTLDAKLLVIKDSCFKHSKIFPNNTPLTDFSYIIKKISTLSSEPEARLILLLASEYFDIDSKDAVYTASKAISLLKPFSKKILDWEYSEKEGYEKLVSAQDDN